MTHGGFIITQLKLVIILALCLIYPNIAYALSEQDGQIATLKNQVSSLYNQYNRILIENELKSNNKLAKYQAKLLIKSVSYDIYSHLRRNGAKRNFAEVEQMVTVAYESSWVFTDFGDNHLARFVTILQWANDESRFKKNTISHWKAGTYFPSLGKRVLRDTTDYGAWQINEMHLKNMRIIGSLYANGTIRFKVKSPRKMMDLMDIPTNCVARCIIETDRKARGWEWRHIQDKSFSKRVWSSIHKCESEGYYHKNFVEKYYNIVPIKKYSSKLLGQN